MKCDIIIPTHNSSTTLALSLPALFAQSLPSNWQVNIILSDDGSEDDTTAATRQLCQHSPWPCHLISSRHTGTAGARNRALQHSKANIILLLGSDIILRPNALQEHLLFHSQNPKATQAALGIVIWDARANPTPFMEWMIHGGSQNNYDSLLGQTHADPKHFFYGSHLSLKRQLITSGAFQETYHSYGWEDLDLGRRLAHQHNISLRVLSKAIGLHHHHYSAPDIINRQIAVGQGFGTFQKEHPTVAVPQVKHPLHKLKYQLFVYTGFLYIISRIIILIERKWSTPHLYKLITSAYFWCGFHNLYPQKNSPIHKVFHNESTN